MLNRILIIVIVLEVIACGTYMWRQLRQPTPALPQIRFDDSLAESELQQLAAATDSGSRRAWRNLAEALLGQGFYGEAEHAFRQAVASDPQDRAAHFGLAFCLDRTGRGPLARPEYLRAARAARHSKGVIASAEHCLYQAGKIDLRATDEAAALKLFKSIKDFPPADYQVAKLLIRNGDIDQGLAIVNSVLENARMSLKFNGLLLHAREASGESERAAKVAETLERSKYSIPVDLNTNYVTPFSQRVGIRKRLQTFERLLAGGDMDAVAAELEKIWLLVEDTQIFEKTMILTSIAAVEFQRRNPEKILHAVTQLKALGVNSADMLQMEGAAYMLQEDPDRAAQLWLRASRISPNIPLHQMLAKYYSRKGNTAQEKHHLAQAALLLAKSAYWSNDLTTARSAARQAAELDETLGAGWFYVGQIEHILGNRDEAAVAYANCLRQSPYHGRAFEALQHLK